MEIVDIELSEFTLRCRSLVVSHVAAGLPRGLEPGEQVVVHDPVRGRWSAQVADLAFEPADTVYRLQLGARLPDDARTGPVDESDLRELLALLRAGRGHAGAVRAMSGHAAGRAAVAPR